jgi:ketose-bisphosphate aldolase
MNQKYQFKDVLLDAYKNHYAIPAFDYTGMFDAKAMIDTACEYKTPIIMMSIAFNYFRPKHFAAFIESYAEDKGVPVFTHVDHARDVALCKEAIDAGFDSVMIDASADPLEENIRKTLEVVEYAHARGVAVEAEMGHIKNGQVTAKGGYASREDFLVQVPDAVELVRRTNVDLLAVGIGNQHGFYVEEPHIHFDRLEEVNNALSLPLVMHGGSGLPQEMVQQSIRGGITKVNVATDFGTHFGDALRDDLNKTEGHAFLMRSLGPAIEAGKEVVRRWIETCMSAGKA